VLLHAGESPRSRVREACWSDATRRARLRSSHDTPRSALVPKPAPANRCSSEPCVSATSMLRNEAVHVDRRPWSILGRTANMDLRRKLDAPAETMTT
jgi:hypothetical protein